MEGHAIPVRSEAKPGEDAMRHSKSDIQEASEPSSDFYMRIKRTIRFDVSGLPIAQGSTRAFIIKNRPIITSTSKGLNQWRQLVAGEAQRRVQKPIEGPIAIELRFRLPRPKSAPKKKWIYPSKRPDIDKLVRAVLDALTHIIIADDSQVVSLTATKDYGPPGVLVQVDEIEV